MEQEQTSLHAETVAMREAMRAEVGDDLTAWDVSAENLAGLSVQTPGLGAAAPDFDLPDAAGRHTRLTELLQEGGVVLVFYRGAWCPYCNLQLVPFRHVPTTSTRREQRSLPFRRRRRTRQPSSHSERISPSPSSATLETRPPAATDSRITSTTTRWLSSNRAGSTWPPTTARGAGSFPRRRRS